MLNPNMLSLHTLRRRPSRPRLRMPNRLMPNRSMRRRRPPPHMSLRRQPLMLNLNMLSLHTLRPRPSRHRLLTWNRRIRNRRTRHLRPCLTRNRQSRRPRAPRSPLILRRRPSLGRKNPRRSPASSINHDGLDSSRAGSGLNQSGIMTVKPLVRDSPGHKVR